MGGGKKSLQKLKRCIVKLKRCMQLLKPAVAVTPVSWSDEVEARRLLMGDAGLVPRGHFAVLAGIRNNEDDEDEQNRFVVDLRYLRSPGMVRLLQEAEEEYGFQQEGALVLPCTPQKLHNILTTHTITPTR